KVLFFIGQIKYCSGNNSSIVLPVSKPIYAESLKLQSRSNTNSLHFKLAALAGLSEAKSEEHCFPK
ncbi:hypothetical protein, partial [Hufsiella arboris]|uniref:hypothetical protein n=1 Tax=Hufsiella arboris TaxID=2695275 RepID=UPI001F268991